MCLNVCVCVCVCVCVYVCVCARANGDVCGQSYQMSERSSKEITYIRLYVFVLLSTLIRPSIFNLASKIESIARFRKLS